MPERIEGHLEAVRSLAALVRAVDAIECGPSYTDRAAGLTHCIIVALPDRASLPLYLEHPKHVQVADIAELRVMDLDLG